MKKYGFVYIWRDKKHKRYYIGCRWGDETDGYICSSNWMKQGFKRRPNDFKRKILSRIYTNKKDLLEEEYKWLSKIKKEKLGKRYYNLHNHHFGHWSSNEQSKLTVGQKISKAHKSNPNHGSWSKGKILSEETKKKISEKTSLGLKNYYTINPRTEKTRKKISENNKRLQALGKIGMRGKKHKTETLEKMKKNNAMNKPEYVAKVKASKQGIKWLSNGLVKKMAIPGTNKYNDLLQNGFYPLNRSN
jgi:hypothetical protein